MPVEDIVAVGMLVMTAAASDEDEGCTMEVESALELMPVEGSVLLTMSDNVLDTAVDVTGVAEGDGPAEAVTTYTPG